MLSVRKHTISQAYEYVIKKVLQEGFENSKTRYLLNVHIEITKPELIDISDLLPNKNEKYIQRYINQVLRGSKNNFKYTYHDRLFNFNGKVNQIQYIIDKLCSDIETRQAIAITIDPERDLIKVYNDGMPCLQEIIINIINKKYFCMTVIFRSNDVYGALWYNMRALIELGKYIKSNVEKKSGLNLIFYRYNHFIANAHIYKTDIPTIEKKLGIKSSNKQFIKSSWIN